MEFRPAVGIPFQAGAEGLACVLNDAVQTRVLSYLFDANGNLQKVIDPGAWVVLPPILRSLKPDLSGEFVRTLGHRGHLANAQAHLWTRA